MSGRAGPALVLSGTPGTAPSGLQPAGFHDKPVLFRELGLLPVGALPASE